MSDQENEINLHPSPQSQKVTGLSSITKDSAKRPHSLSAPSLTSQQTELSNTSFTELVTVDDEGHPYIDINRLLYKPVKQPGLFDDYESKDERLTWYIPDFAFIIFNLISLCISTHFCLIGITSLTWKASLGMFSLPPCWELYNGSSFTTPDREEDFYYVPCRRFTKDAGSEFTWQKGYNFFTANNFPILRTKLTDVHYFGLMLVCIELINVINVVVGINACLQGYRGILIGHIVVDSLIMLGEFAVTAVVTFTSVCDSRDLKAIREILKNFVQWYGNSIRESNDGGADRDVRPVKEELDALQINLGCCGVDGWVDYLAFRFPQSSWFSGKEHLDESEMVIPFSCCKPWWIRNIYCSHGVHLWAHPLATAEEANKFEERITQEGCMYKLEHLCLNLRTWMGVYGFVITAVHFFVIVVESISVLVLIRNISDLIQKNKQIMRQKEMMHETGDSDLDLSTGMSSALKDGNKSNWAKVPPPTEDDIITIKQRSNFTSFMSRVKGGMVGKWMRQANNIVTEGHALTDEATTEDEKKQRDKELLHNKGKSIKDNDEGLNRYSKSDKGKRGVNDKERKSNESWKKAKAKASIASKKPSKFYHMDYHSRSSGLHAFAHESFGTFATEHSTTPEAIARQHKKKRKTRVLWRRKLLEEEEATATTEDLSYNEGMQRMHRRKKKKKIKQIQRDPWFKNW